MLEVTDLEVAFPSPRGRHEPVIALDGIDLEVHSGEVVAVLGPSGGGKSTLLRVVAGLTEPGRGQVLLGGADLAGVAPHRRGIGLMFQDDTLFPHRDVAGNVAFGLRMQRMPVAQRRARVDELLGLVGLGDVVDRDVATLSGGQAQRVALARALAPQPRLLLLDEPLASLDRTLRDRLVGELRELFTRLGVTVLSVTHDQDEAFALADRVVLLDAGRVVQTGTPEEVWRVPASTFVARFLGFSNVAPATYENGTLHTPWGPVAAPRPAFDPRFVLVRPDAVRLDDAGDIVGEVTARTLRGDRVIYALSPPDVPGLEGSAHLLDAPQLGARVRVRIAPTDVVPLSR